jgi:hypothetical protein
LFYGLQSNQLVALQPMGCNSKSSTEKTKREQPIGYRLELSKSSTEKTKRVVREVTQEANNYSSLFKEKNHD